MRQFADVNVKTTVSTSMFTFYTIASLYLKCVIGDIMCCGLA